MSNNSGRDQHIVIIGAGATGLMAARELSRLYNVTILEAQPSPGGRIRTLYDTSSENRVESGAEFVHGELPVTLGLLKEAGISYTEIEGDMYQVVNGQWKKQDEMIEGWDKLLDRMGEVEDDLTLEMFLQKYYSKEKDEVICRHVKRYAQGFDLADVSRVSVRSLYNEWYHEQDKNFRIDAGYDRLVDFLASECIKNGCVIHTSSIVKQIKWKHGHVHINTMEGKTFDAQKVIVTVALGVLQNKNLPSSILFTPAIDDYGVAVRNIGFGNVIKISLLFKNAFWESKQKNIGFILSDEKIPTWWTQLPSGIPLLTGWLGGPPADELSDKNESAILELALTSLLHIFQTDPTSLLISSHITNWSNEEWVQGAYSYSIPGSSAARQKLNTPVQDTIYFAGEALYEGTSPGTVEAALASGKLVAELIMQLL